MGTQWANRLAMAWSVSSQIVRQLWAEANMYRYTMSTLWANSDRPPCHSLQRVEVLLTQHGDGHAPRVVVLLPVRPHRLLYLALLPKLRLRQRRAVAHL